MLRYKYEYSVTSGIKEILADASGGESTSVIVKGMDVEKVDFFNFKVNTGYFIIINNPYIIENYTDDVFDIRSFMPTMSTPVPDGKHILIATLIGGNEIKYELLKQTSLAIPETWEEPSSQDYAVLAIIHTVNSTIYDVLYEYATWKRFDFSNVIKTGVAAINGKNGFVYLSSDDIPEGTANVYYTEERVKNNEDVSLNTQNRHHHDNKEILDNITAYFTAEEKAKLAILEKHYQGIYPDLQTLQSSVTDPKAGDYADVDGGTSDNITRYVYDPSDNTWIVSVYQENASDIKQKYESNPDTNAFNDQYKNEVDELYSMKNDINANTSNRHTHANKSLLDSIKDTGDGYKFLSDDGQYKSVGMGNVKFEDLIFTSLRDKNGFNKADYKKLEDENDVILVSGNSAFNLYNDNFTYDASQNDVVYETVELINGSVEYSKFMFHVEADNIPTVEYQLNDDTAWTQFNLDTYVDTPSTFTKLKVRITFTDDIGNFNSYGVLYDYNMEPDSNHIFIDEVTGTKYKLIVENKNLVLKLIQ